MTEGSRPECEFTGLLSTIQEELEVFRSALLPFDAKSYRPEARPHNANPSLAYLLCDQDPISIRYLVFEKRCKEMLHTLQNISKLRNDLINVTRTVEEAVTGLYSRVLTQALARLELCYNFQAAKPSIPHSTTKIGLEYEISIRLRRFQLPASLSFLSPSGDPSTCRETMSSSSFGLDPRDETSKCVIDQLIWIQDVVAEIKTANNLGLLPKRVHELVAGLEEHRQNIKTHVESERFRGKNQSANIVKIMHKCYYPLLAFSPNVVMTALMVLSLRLVYHLPTRAISMFLYHFRRNLIGYGLSPASIAHMARDPRSYRKVIDLDVDEELFLLCPLCASSYQVDKNGQPNSPVCTSRMRLGAKQCGGNLRRDNLRRLKGTQVPHIYRRRKLSNWIQALLSRPGLLETMDSVWDQAHGPPHNPSCDFWGGTFIREMKGPDPSKLFSSIPVGETRLLFSLAVDWFNPFYNKIAGKSISTGVLFMTCLNIPPEKRHKEENVFLVGVMPGRRQSPQLNGILRTLVDELIPYWHEGIFFFGIPLKEQPLLIRCALVQLICDLPAARKVAGFPGHGATYGCSVCLVGLKQMADTDLAESPAMKRTKEDHIQHANLYKEALNGDTGIKGAEKLLKNNSHGVRWSPLNDLPYWDPVKCTILDAMHLILLGLCQIHWRRFWHADNVSKRSDTRKEDQDQHLTTSFLPNVQELPESAPPNHQDRDEDGWVDVEPPEIIAWEQEILPSYLENDEPLQLLDSQKMKEARTLWIYGTDRSLSSSLSIDQILCLLKENGSVPEKYKNKEELMGLLSSCRHGFPSLPKQRPTAKNRKLAHIHLVSQPRSPFSSSTDRSSGHRISPSEIKVLDLASVPIPNVTRAKNGAKVIKMSYITRDELEAIQKDIRSTIVPSWITKLTTNFGERSNGKMKADEWRSLLEIYLPMSLLRLWTDSNERWADSKKRALHLKALLALSIIVTLVCSRTVSSFSTDLYSVTIKYYLNLMSVLCPNESLVISHHLALHLPTFMQLHGPSRTHWAFPYERLIGKLQKILHNSRMEDVPGTLSRGFWSSTMLQSLSSHGVEVATLPRWCGDLSKPKPKPEEIALNPAVKEALKNIFNQPASWACKVKKISVGDVKYQVGNDSSIGNANVGYTPYNDRRSYQVGRIGEILKVRTQGGRKEEVVFLIHRHENPPRGFNQHLWHEVLAHRAIGLRVVGTQVGEEPDIVPLACVVGHVAINNMTGAYGEALITFQLTRDIEARRAMT